MFRGVYDLNVLEYTKTIFYIYYNAQRFPITVNVHVKD